MNTTSDILVIGGGVIGLAIAIELKLRSHSVTVLSRDFYAAASNAAAGMLAPQAEDLPPGPMFDLCLLSRSLYPEWISKLEGLTGEICNYWSCGILAPVYGDTQPSNSQSSSKWLDQHTIHSYQPGLSSDVIGGWWYPEDAQVDNRALTQALRIAAQTLGVDLQEGVTVEALSHEQGRVTGVQTTTGLFHAEHYVLATGAWSNEILPIPVQPKKGQMLSVRVPDAHRSSLQRILYGSNIYIVPRRTNRIIIGATVEDVGFTPDNTPLGIQLLEQAIQLYPQLQHYPIEEIWWGFRPATPDELPILGSSSLENLTFATGHYRNGILLAPVTAKLIANLILDQADPLLKHFHYSRFHPLTQNANNTSP